MPFPLFREGALTLFGIIKPRGRHICRMLHSRSCYFRLPVYRNLLHYAVVLGLVSITAAFGEALVQVPKAIDHSPWHRLLQKHVNARGLVAYRAWHASSEDRKALDQYLKQFAGEANPPAKGDDRIASLINAYNAFTIDFILDNYPVKSLRLLDDEFKGKRYLISGTAYSAEDIELETLRPLIGWKMHSVVVCAARSCPPLLNRASFPDDWEKKMEARYRAWLSRPDLNSYHPDRGWGSRGEVEISKIFSWHSIDFEGEVSVRDVLHRFGPEEHSDFLGKGKYRIRYKDYHWGLNDQSGLGKDYEHSIFNSLF